ncbi:Tn3 family transposase [Sphingomonas sp. CFBP 13733]|uniref:Tn3 family transposase n=2 Tax=unclassified Sphingomonas TaxID=196159 RepID=UPI00177F46BF|nr:Tn3 family transposase [Sphingomonas sp. CFBP 13733]MBD8641704.1 Tn3 family transposase [Sphingomonas sp. CFBP 13733]
MPSRTILSPAQRSAIFDPPADRATIERLYTLGPDDLGQVARRRRGPNRLGYAVQLCYLRHPGRSLLPGETVPAAMLALLADQIGCRIDDFADYSARATTLREHRAEVEAYLGLRSFNRIDVRSVLALGSEIATSTDRGDAIVAGMVDRLRLDRIVLPAASTLERLALIVRAQARKAAHAGLIRDCSSEQETALERLIASDDKGRTRLGWIREWPEAPSASNLKGIVERLDAVRGIGIATDRARRIHAARYAVIARTAGIVTAQHLRRLERPRRLAMLVASMIEMEAALTDAALVMVEKMVGALFRRADRTRSDRLLGQARMLKDTARLHARLGRLLVDARASGRDAFRVIDAKVGWDQLERSIRFAEDLTRSADDGLGEVVERYPAVRRFAAIFLAAFTFRTARSGDPLLGAIEVLRTMYRDGRSVLPKRAPTSFIKPRWRKIVEPAEGTIDRRAYEIAVIVHLRERLGSGSVWVDGSRAYRTLDDYLLPVPAFDTMRTDGNLRLAVPSGFAEWHEDRRTVMTRRMTEVERAAATGELVDVTIERGQLLISPIRRSPSEDAEALKARLYAMLPRVRITNLLVEVAAWSRFADRFVHARSGEPASDQSALMGAILADATNLGLGRMAESSRGLTLSRLRWTAEWHVRDETYLSALAAIVDCHTAHPLAQVWGPGDTSSSDGQFFRAGGQGEARADRNARYGTEPGVLFYTHVTDRFTPFHTKVIAANAGEAAHVLDGLLDHESELVIREHATDTAGAVDHVFGLCHLLGFRFAPRIRDLNERRLYGLSSLDPWPILRPLVAGPVNVRAIEEHWDETLRLAASIRAGTVSASVMLRKLAGFPRQNPVARALREIGRIERTLFMLDWFDDPEQRRRTGSILNKGEARNALARAIFFNRLGELRDRTFENQRHRASGLTLLTAAVTLWNTVYLDRAVRHLRGSGVDVPDELLAHVAPLGWEHVGLTGDYLWSEIDKPRERFRPLRLHQQRQDA